MNLRIFFAAFITLTLSFFISFPVFAVGQGVDPGFYASVLPATGGIGTKIFYILGGILLIVGLVLILVKRRMSSKNSEEDV